MRRTTLETSRYESFARGRTNESFVRDRSAHADGPAAHGHALMSHASGGVSRGPRREIDRHVWTAQEVAQHAKHHHHAESHHHAEGADGDNGTIWDNVRITAAGLPVPGHDFASLCAPPSPSSLLRLLCTSQALRTQIYTGYFRNLCAAPSPSSLIGLLCP